MQDSKVHTTKVSKDSSESVIESSQQSKKKSREQTYLSQDDIISPTKKRIRTKRKVRDPYCE